MHNLTAEEKCQHTIMIVLQHIHWYIVQSALLTSLWPVMIWMSYNSCRSNSMTPSSIRRPPFILLVPTGISFLSTTSNSGLCAAILLVNLLLIFQCPWTCKCFLSVKLRETLSLFHQKRVLNMAWEAIYRLGCGCSIKYIFSLNLITSGEFILDSTS